MTANQPHTESLLPWRACPSFASRHGASLSCGAARWRTKGVQCVPAMRQAPAQGSSGPDSAGRNARRMPDASTASISAYVWLTAVFSTVAGQTPSLQATPATTPVAFAHSSQQCQTPPPDMQLPNSSEDTAGFLRCLPYRLPAVSMSSKRQAHSYIAHRRQGAEDISIKTTCRSHPNSQQSSMRWCRLSRQQQCTAAGCVAAVSCR